MFPKHHPKAGQPTFFVEKIYKSLGQEFVEDKAIEIAARHTDLRKHSINDFATMKDINYEKIMSFEPKYHTIRAGSRWKVGDKFSPRIWTGLPYRSKQFQFAPDMEVIKIYDIEMAIRGDFKQFSFIDNPNLKASVEEVAKNDGLSLSEFLDWFDKPFIGQIICWSDAVSYG